MSMSMGCESGREEGIPSGPLPGAQTDEFRKTMETAGNKMMKGRMGKKAGNPGTKGAEADKAKNVEADKAATPQ
jgi:hypothetical protein